MGKRGHPPPPPPPPIASHASDGLYGWWDSRVGGVEMLGQRRPVLYLRFIPGVVGGGGRLKRRRTWSRRARIAVWKATKLRMRAGPTDDRAAALVERQRPRSPCAGRRVLCHRRAVQPLFVRRLVHGLGGDGCPSGDVAGFAEGAESRVVAGVPPLFDFATRPPTPPSDDLPPHL